MDCDQTGNEKQEGAQHAKHNTRAYQRDTCNNSRIAAVSPTRFYHLMMAISTETCCDFKNFRFKNLNFGFKN
jgi:hypothetical protein